MRHIMVDLETWGLHRGHAIRSIAVVPFNPFDGWIGNSGQSFYQNVGWESQENVGLTKMESTADWWAEPWQASAAALLELDQVSVHAALGFLDRYLRCLSGNPLVEDDTNTAAMIEDVRVWTRGRMDLEVLEGVYDAIGRKFPFHYRMPRDSRFLMDLVEFNTDWPHPPFEGIPHYALDDAVNECKLVNQLFEFTGLRGWNQPEQPQPGEVLK